MGAVVISDKVTTIDLEIARQDYGDYMKIVVDVETGTVAIGGEWHADAEKLLLAAGSKQQNLWGGGIDIATRQVDFNSLINIRPNLNASQEILDVKIRTDFEQIIKVKFAL